MFLYICVDFIVRVVEGFNINMILMNSVNQLCNFYDLSCCNNVTTCDINLWAFGDVLD